MTRDDVIRIFNSRVEGDALRLGFATTVPINAFLEIFGDVEPTKQALLERDAGRMGYADLIESGNYA